MTPIFLQTRITGDWNKITYSLKKLKSTKNETRTQIWFTPNEDADPREIQSEIKRGKTFATLQDGMLFGAMVSLRKLGTFSEKTH